MVYLIFAEEVVVSTSTCNSREVQSAGPPSLGVRNQDLLLLVEFNSLICFKRETAT